MGRKKEKQPEGNMSVYYMPPSNHNTTKIGHHVKYDDK